MSSKDGYVQLAEIKDLSEMDLAILVEEMLNDERRFSMMAWRVVSKLQSLALTDEEKNLLAPEANLNDLVRSRHCIVSAT